MVNLLPAFTSLVATAAKLSRNFLPSAGFTPAAAATAAAMPDFDMAAAPFIAAAFIARGAMAWSIYEQRQRGRCLAG